jgi:hypothetical protein
MKAKQTGATLLYVSLCTQLPQRTKKLNSFGELKYMDQEKLKRENRLLVN